MVKRLFLITAVIIFSSLTLQAHCDGEDGPVIKAAKKSLETGNINYVLIWVNEKSEAELKEAFGRAYNSSTPATQKSFFEALVKLHREHEGEEFTGIKPAGRYNGTIIPAADLAVEKNSMEPLSEFLNEVQLKRIKKYFDKVIENKNYELNDVAEGRKYVAAYVEFFHHLEHLTKHHDKEG